MTDALDSQLDAGEEAWRLRGDRLRAQRAIQALQSLDDLGERREEEVATFRELVAVSGLRHLFTEEQTRRGAWIRRIKHLVVRVLRRLFLRVPVSATTKRRLVRRVGADQWARGTR